jgi:hypothetical protein
MAGLGHLGAPVAAPAASAHSSDSKLTLDTARRFVSLDVPELDAEVVNSFVEVGAVGATRFRCPCFVVRDSCGGRGSNKSSSVTLTRRRNLSKQPIIALVSTIARLGLAVGREAEGCVSTAHQCRFLLLFFVLLATCRRGCQCTSTKARSTQRCRTCRVRGIARTCIGPCARPSCWSESLSSRCGASCLPFVSFSRRH